ncbi:reverse transcriptase domain-containing protein [Bacillus atrophaeus]|uniref:reverse transcriptase domain-containing protein n=1 Tax=Bacillus atrophaeus TaxID=1452 RepID=UPI002880091E|nr:reverse transcriptase domain-containing protein [Bacillus atrophaeus]MDS9998525.1 reverse transcriptase domain-containing protein [Bacillus atrophaeus]
MSLPAYKHFKVLYKTENLKDLYEKTIHYNTVSGIDRMVKRVFDKKVDLHLGIINRKVFNGTYKYTAYREKLFIKSKSSFPRVISIPTIRDKIVLKGLHKIIQESFSIEQPLVQTVIGDMKNELKNFDSFIKIDIKNFYDNINHSNLDKKLSKKIRTPLVKNLILNAIRTPTVSKNHSKEDSLYSNCVGVPQGLSISNVLAEVYFQDMDKKYKTKKRLRYYRYVDDILILCNEKDIPNIKNDIFKEIEEEHKLKLNKGKCSEGRLDLVGYDFLGYRIEKLKSTGDIGLTIKKSTKLKFEKSIVDMFSRYSHSNNISPREFIFYLNNKITGSISNKVNGTSEKEKKYGWVFFYSQIDDINVFYHFDWFVKKLIDDFKLKQNFKGLEIKNFVKTYYEIIYNRSRTKYIHRPDILSIDEKRFLLIDTFNVKERSLKTDDQIERFYYAKVYKPIKLLEQDVQDFS